MIEINIEDIGIDLSAELADPSSPGKLRIGQGSTVGNDHMANLSPIIHSSDHMVSQLQSSTAFKSPPIKDSERKSLKEANVLKLDTLDTARTDANLVVKKEIEVDMEAQQQHKGSDAEKKKPAKKRSCKCCIIVTLIVLLLAGAAAVALWFFNPFEEAED